MATITSNAFTIIVNKSAYIDTSIIKVVRGITDLIAVDSNPTAGQFSFSITSCTGCSAVKADVDTVGIVSTTSDISTIEISINAENVKTYTKQITVAKIKQGSRGPQGVAGADGRPGKDGTSTYTWIKYADDANGNGLSNDPTGKSYIGFAYNKDTATESNNASDYIWAKIQGEKGDTGVQGPKGADGKTTYTWIKYSDYKDGTNLYDTPTSNTLYIGIATNKTTATESSNKTDYVWSRFKGDKGEKGEAGKDGTSINILGSLSSTSQLPATGYSGDCYIIGGDLYVWSATTNAWENCGQIKGEPGDSAYFHIKYSDDMRTFTDNNGEEVGIYIGVLTDGNKEDSMTFSDYKWSRFRGEQGVTGEKGQSLTKSTPQWYASTSNTTQTGGSWQDTMPTITTGKYIWQRFKNVWANPTATTYTTPVLEQIAESIKEVTSKQSEYKQTLDEVSSTLTQTTATANEAKTQASTNKQTIDSISTTLTSTTRTANEAKAQSSTNKQTIDSMSTELTSATTTANNALSKATSSQQNLDGFKTTVSNTYVTKTDAGNTYATKSALSEVKQTADGLTTEVSKKLNSADLSSRIQQSPNDIKIGFNKINNFITIDPTNGLQVNHTDGSYTRISPGGFSLYNASKNYRYKALIATGYFSIKGKGTSVITLPAQFDDVSEWDIDFFFTIETNWGAASSAVDKTCIYEMYANDIFQIGMTKDSDGHWTKKVDYSLIDVCVKAGGSMQVGDRGNMFGFVHWIAFA